ncbi:hypothetical protein ACFXA9_28500, partial [Streptomyces sp. NPDC059411]
PHAPPPVAIRQLATIRGGGFVVLHITPRKLRDWPEQQAAVVRTALTASGDREPAAYLVVLPR